MLCRIASAARHIVIVDTEHHTTPRTHHHHVTSLCRPRHRLFTRQICCVNERRCSVFERKRLQTIIIGSIELCVISRGACMLTFIRTNTSGQTHERHKIILICF